MPTGECSTLSIGECAREWATKALSGPPNTDLHWLIATAFVSGGAEQAKRDGTYPCDDERPVDLAELARQVAIELRKRGIRAMACAGIACVDIGGFTHPITTTHPTFSYETYCIQWSRFDNLGPVGCANEIQALETKRAQDWAGDNAT